MSMILWKQEIATISDLRTDRCDQLDFVSGRLTLQKSQEFRIAGTPVVIQPGAVTDHLDQLIKTTATQCFAQIQGAEYEQVVDFKRELKSLGLQLSDLQETFRQNDPLYTRFAELYEKGNALLNQVKLYKSTLKKPEQRPPKHYVYDERTNVRTIKGVASPRVPLDDIVAAAKVALSLATVHRDHKWAFQLFVMQILHRPWITEEAALAFETLVPHAEVLSLEYAQLASPDICELGPYMEKDISPNPIPMDEFLKAIKAICNLEKLNPPSLDMLNTLYIELKGHYRRSLNGETFEAYINRHPGLLANLDKSNSLNYFITPKVLMQVLQSAAKSATCHKISISKHLSKLQVVQDFLKNHSYHYESGTTYRRKG